MPIRSKNWYYGEVQPTQPEVCSHCGEKEAESGSLCLGCEDQLGELNHKEGEENGE